MVALRSVASGKPPKFVEILFTFQTILFIHEAWVLTRPDHETQRLDFCLCVGMSRFSSSGVCEDPQSMHHTSIICIHSLYTRI